MTFRRPTDAQKKARARNWRIRRLRALWAQCDMLTGERRTMAKSAIDAELVTLGAEPETARKEYRSA